MRALAEAADVSASTVHRIEQGKMHPTVEMLGRLIEAAGEVLRVSSVPGYTTALVGLARELPGDDRNAIRKVAEFVARFRNSNRERQLRMID